MSKDNRKQNAMNSRFKPVEKPKNAKKTMSRLLKYMSSFKLLFMIISILVITSTIINLANSSLVKSIISSFGSFDFDENTWITYPNKELFIRTIIIISILYLLDVVVQYFSSLCGSYLAIKTTRKIRSDLFYHMVYLPISYTDTTAHGDLMSRMTNDVDNITNAVTNSISNLISGIVMIVGCFALMLWNSPLLTLVSLISIILTFIVTFFISKVMKPLFVKQQALLGKLNTQTEEMVTGIKTVMAYNHEDEAIKMFNNYSDDYCKCGIKANIISGSMGPLMNFIGNVGYFLVSFFGAIFVVKGIGPTLLGEPLDVAIIVFFLRISKKFTRPINQVAQLYSQILSALSGAERIFDVLDQKVEDVNYNNEVINSDDIIGNINFDHIKFGYTEDKIIIKDFSVEVYSGHKIALVGATGSGKTTIVNLLMRFYDINDGNIYVDGYSIFDMSKKDLRDSIAIVLQDAVLFEDTIYNNVLYGRTNATEEEVQEAIKLANCESFIKKLPDGINTMLSEGGSNLSSGQRQLLTIARAILANPKILILDEATSSVDTRTEKKIQDALVNLMKNRTSIIIAHRLSTIQDADLIVVLDNGSVMEMGNHKELLELKGVYNRLYETQFKGLTT